MNTVTKELCVIYFVTLLLFFSVKGNLGRFVAACIFYTGLVSKFNLGYDLGVLYFLVGVAAALTEHVFINYISSSWDYRKPDIISLPYWLFPLWGIAVILITQICDIFKKTVNSG
tara:strand:+ start:319 stop:663 length:345 start_codon:yes stop_codon:yes gene_type:complete